MHLQLLRYIVWRAQYPLVSIIYLPIFYRCIDSANIQLSNIFFAWRQILCISFNLLEAMVLYLLFYLILELQS